MIRGDEKRLWIDSSMRCGTKLDSTGSQGTARESGRVQKNPTLLPASFNARYFLTCLGNAIGSTDRATCNTEARERKKFIHRLLLFQSNSLIAFHLRPHSLRYDCPSCMKKAIFPRNYLPTLQRVYVTFYECIVLHSIDFRHASGEATRGSRSASVYPGRYLGKTNRDLGGCR